VRPLLVTSRVNTEPREIFGMQKIALLLPSGIRGLGASSATECRTIVRLRLGKCGRGGCHGDMWV